MYSSFMYQLVHYYFILYYFCLVFFFFFKQKTAYEMRISDWSSDVCSSDLADYLRKISPVFHAQNIKKPLLVLQGANDPRVLPVESEDIVAKVKANGVPVDYIVFPDEGHGFRKKANQIAAYRAILQFLDTHVKIGRAHV